jgi:hypothetical protein
MELIRSHSQQPTWDKRVVPAHCLLGSYLKMLSTASDSEQKEVQIRYVAFDVLTAAVMVISTF